MARLSARLRLGAVALGLCALLFAAFPLVRPFFNGLWLAWGIWQKGARATEEAEAFSVP